MIRKTLAASLLAFAVPASGVDGVSAEAGAGSDDVTMWRVGAQWSWQRRWLADGSWQLGGYWDLSAGAWRNEHDTLYDLGLTPTFRFAAKDGGSPYVEAAIGFHLLSDTHISRERRFGSAFQFGDHVGAGVRFGPERRYDLSLRLQHLSNAGIRKPNPGIDFLQVRFQLHL